MRLELPLWDCMFEKYDEGIVWWASREFKIDNLRYIVIARKEPNDNGWSAWCEVFLMDMESSTGKNFGWYKRVNVLEKNNLSIEDLDDYFNSVVNHFSMIKSKVK